MAESQALAGRDDGPRHDDDAYEIGEEAVGSVDGNINDFVLTIVEKAAGMICCRARSLVVDLPKE